MQKIALLLFAGLVAVAMGDACAAATNCQACVEIQYCGWCSVPVQYSNGTQGPQCAGFAPHSVPFTCPGVYSTETCQRGYVCNPESGTCSLGAPGQGNTLAECESECTKNNTQVYVCDEGTKTCNAVPPGTANSSSLQICEAICSGSPTPSPGPTASVYACNTTNWQCQMTTPGHGASLLVCQEQCNASNTLYVCNLQDGECVSVPPLTPGGVNITTCQQECQNVTPAPIPPNPGPPPEYIGTWRGVEIQNNYNILEWDVMINTSWAIFESITATATSYFAGVPYHIPNSPVLEMWVEIQDGMGKGLTIRTIGDTSGARGPETVFCTMAVGVAGGATPTSIDDAMTDGTDKVLGLVKCIPNEDFCAFILPSTMQSKIDKARKLHEQSLKVNTGLNANDRCMQYDQSCEVCLAQQFCGWCSVPVTYSDGTKGTQCAGFEGNSTAFVCPGHYSTTSCEVGYICTSELTCVPTVPGDGMPQEVCLQTCKATPPPAPTVPQYVCNLQTHQCSLCTQTPCPGSMPQAQCVQLCPNPYPGPTPALMGVWRGIYIQQGYSVGETDWVMNSTGATVYKDGVFYFHATIISLGSDVMLFTIDQGANTGKTFGTLYQMAYQYQQMYNQMTMAIGVFDENFPSDFNTPMYTTGMQEVVLAQCLKSPCTFPTP